MSKQYQNSSKMHSSVAVLTWAVASEIQPHSHTKNCGIVGV